MSEWAWAGLGFVVLVAVLAVLRVKTGAIAWVLVFGGLLLSQHNPGWLIVAVGGALRIAYLVGHDNGVRDERRRADDAKRSSS